MVSADQGDTWIDLAQSGTYVSAETSWGHYEAKASYFNTSWDGFWYSHVLRNYGGTNATSRPFQWKLLDARDADFIINATTGQDCLKDPTDGWSEPYDFRFHNAPVLKFETDYTPNYAPGSAGIVVNKNSVLVSADEVTALTGSYTGVDAWVPSGFAANVEGSITVANNDTVRNAVNSATQRSSNRRPGYHPRASAVLRGRATNGGR